MTKQRITELVTTFSQGRGNDDVAGEQIREAGEPARQALLELLRDRATDKEHVPTIMMILHMYFPSPDTYAALEQYASTISDPHERTMFLQILHGAQANDPRK